MRLLIDGDMILYRVGFASQHTWYYVYIDQEEEDGWVARFKYKKQAVEWVNGQEDMIIVPSIIYDDLPIALYNADQLIKRVEKECRYYFQDIGKWDGKSEIEIYLSDSHLERDDMATLQIYKGNRLNAPKPFWYEEIKRHLLREYSVFIYPKLEADDGMAINQSEESIICTPDKDLDMVPGERWKGGKVFAISNDQARLSFYTQLLTGDATDNIPGLYKLTGKRAKNEYKKTLETLTSDYDMYNYIKSLYIDGFGCGEQNDVDVVLHEVGNLLWMKRSPEDSWRIPVGREDTQF